jgi:hypothetical protein
MVPVKVPLPGPENLSREGGTRMMRNLGQSSGARR